MDRDGTMGGQPAPKRSCGDRAAWMVLRSSDRPSGRYRMNRPSSPRRSFLCEAVRTAELLTAMKFTHPVVRVRAPKMEARRDYTRAKRDWEARRSLRLFPGRNRCGGNVAAPSVGVYRPLLSRERPERARSATARASACDPLRDSGRSRRIPFPAAYSRKAMSMS